MMDLQKVAIIEQVRSVLNVSAINQGYYNFFRVHVRESETAKWVECTRGIGSKMNSLDAYLSFRSTEELLFDKLQCSNIVYGRFVKVSVGRNVPLYLSEVKVMGTYLEGISFIPPLTFCKVPFLHFIYTGTKSSELLTPIAYYF